MQLHLYNHQLNSNFWQQSGNLFFTGSVFIGHKKADVKEVERQLKLVVNDNFSLEEWLRSLDGSFAFIYKSSEAVVAAVDLCRSIPLAYNEEGFFAIGADFSVPINSEALSQLLQLEVIQGKGTFYKNIWQLQAGQFLRVENGRKHVKSYFKHFRNKTSIGIDNAKKEFSALIDKLEKRLVAQLNGKTALVPLSGGYDSRFILALLVSSGYHEIQAFTYGQSTGYEAKTAKKVCEKLGVEWQLIEYNHELFENTDLEKFNAFCAYGAGFGSVPQEQEFFALSDLAKKFKPDEYFLLPGFCGDVQAGSFIPDKFFESKWYKTRVSPKQYLTDNYSRGCEVEASDELFEDFWEFYSHIEEWVLRERESKYIINGIRAYEFFGFDWYLPLWQKDFIEFWRKAPSEYRRDRKLYIEVLNEKLLEPLGIALKSGGFDSRFTSGGVNTYLRHVLPKGIKTNLKKLLIPKNELEINNLNYFAKLLGQKMGKEFDEETLIVNEVMGEYLVYLLKKTEQSS